MDLKGLDKEWRGFTDHDIKKARGEESGGPQRGRGGARGRGRDRGAQMQPPRTPQVAREVREEGGKEEEETQPAQVKEDEKPERPATPPEVELRERF